MAIFFIYGSYENISTWIVGVLILFNVYLGTNNRRFHLGSFYIDSRSDGLDFIRWFINITYIDFYFFQTIPIPPSTALVLWIGVQITCYPENHGNKKIQRFFIVYASALQILFFYLKFPDQISLWENMFYLYFNIGILLCINYSFKLSEWSEEESVQLNHAKKVLESQISELCHQAHVGENLCSISHELNNILTIVELASESDETYMKDAIRTSRSQAKELSRIILEGFHNSKQNKEKALDDILNDLRLLYGKFMAKQGINFQIEVEENIKPDNNYKFDKNLFFILSNFLRNAFDATVCGSKQQEKRIRLKIFLEGDSLLIFIQDSGKGLEKGEVIKIMQHQMLTTKKDGYGFGLKFALRECERLNIPIKIDSIPSHGTTIQLKVPLNA